jgi:hypothetical protein
MSADPIPVVAADLVISLDPYEIVPGPGNDHLGRRRRRRLGDNDLLRETKPSIMFL